MTDNNRNRNVGRGMSLPSVLLVIFIVLKLTGTIAWSWVWVLSPLWIGASLGLLFFLVIGIILLFGIIGIIDNSSRMIHGIKGWFHKQDWDEEY